MTATRADVHPVAEFILTQLKLDEEAAQGAGSHQWSTDDWKPHGGRVGCTVVNNGPWDVAVCEGAWVSPKDGEKPGDWEARVAEQAHKDAAHIARHDPARIMREVRSKRCLVNDCLLRIREAASPEGSAARRLALKVDAISAEMTLRDLASAYPESDEIGLGIHS